MGPYGEVLPAHVPLQRRRGRPAEDDHHRQEEYSTTKENDHVVCHLIVYNQPYSTAIINSSPINKKYFFVFVICRSKVNSYYECRVHWLSCTLTGGSPRPLSPILPNYALSDSWLDNAADITLRRRTGETRECCKILLLSQTKY